MASANIILERLISLQPCDDPETKEVYRIGDLARKFDVSLRTLRFYEDRGLISPERSGSTRLYSNRDKKRLKIILLAKNVGFSLIDIQELLKIYDMGDLEHETSTIVRKFSEQLEKLKEQKIELEKSIEDLQQAIGVMQEMD